MCQNNKLQATSYNLQPQRGVSLYMTFMVMALLLGIGLGMSAVLVSQLDTLRGIGYSVLAFYATDAGVERAIYEDNKWCATIQETAQRLTCLRNKIAVIPADDLKLSNEATFSLSADAGGEGVCPQGLSYCVKSAGTYKNSLRAVRISRGGFVQTSFFVKPYLVYPADKPMYPEYETAVNAYLAELQNWYRDKVGETFTLKPLVVVRSTFDYLIMRCGPTPTSICLNGPSILEGNWGMYMNMAIHNGQEQWEAETAALIFGAGGGGYAGANKSPNDTGWAISGDWVLEPISGTPNTWGIPCSYSDGWQCTGGVPKGTPAHELGHAFGLPHPGEQYVDQTIMQWHGNFPEPGLLQQEIDFLKSSPFFP